MFGGTYSPGEHCNTGFCCLQHKRHTDKNFVEGPANEASLKCLSTQMKTPFLIFYSNNILLQQCIFQDAHFT